VWVMVTIFLALSVPSSLAVEKRFIFGLPPGAIEANDLPRGWASCYGFTTITAYGSEMERRMGNMNALKVLTSL
jgi:hypothetical protein